MACSDCGVKPMCAITGMPAPDDPLDARGHPGAALELDGVREALLHHPDGRRERLVGPGLVGAERQVGDDQACGVRCA